MFHMDFTSNLKAHDCIKNAHNAKFCLAPTFFKVEN